MQTRRNFMSSMIGSIAALAALSVGAIAGKRAGGAAKLIKGERINLDLGKAQFAGHVSREALKIDREIYCDPSINQHAPWGRIQAGDAMCRMNEIQCFIDGKDVTRYTYDADDREGWVRYYAGDVKGVIQHDGRNTIKIEVHGNVRFIVTPRPYSPAYLADLPQSERLYTPDIYKSIRALQAS